MASKEYNRRYREEHADYFRKYNRLYYLAHKEKILARAKEWHSSHKDVNRLHKRKRLGIVDATGEAGYNGVCEICGTLSSLVYDHDHLTGKFRGWLCSVCNRALGFVEKKDFLQKALDYLKRKGSL